MPSIIGAACEGEPMKIRLAPFVLAAALVLTGCGGTETAEPAAETPEASESSAASATSAPAQSSATAAPPTTTNPEPAEVDDLTGAWTQVNRNSEDSYQQATITADTITVEWVTDGGNTTSIYWIGTFVPPVEPSDLYTWSSERDVAATQSAMLASSDPTKDFTLTDNTISYKVTALGTTTTVELQKP